jgi:hypothetical protein
VISNQRLTTRYVLSSFVLQQPSSAPSDSPSLSGKPSSAPSDSPSLSGKVSVAKQAFARVMCSYDVQHVTDMM